MNTLGTVAAEDQTVVKAFVREYVDNGLAVYDAARKPLGMVADYDRPGGGFVVRLVQAGACLFIPMRFVRKVAHGRVYLSEPARNLTQRPL
ncbi:MAG TPA: hypothetical protein VHK65_10195 [Candidatus Dormibacteraeota bacterium]|nr:hypothetical protein [Candidatus Dormibacteraeota bacterium]